MIERQHTQTMHIERNLMRNPKNLFSLYDAHYQRYLYHVASDDLDVALSDLYISCKYLTIAAAMNHRRAKAKLTSDCANQIIFMNELDKLSNQDFLKK